MPATVDRGRQRVTRDAQEIADLRAMIERHVAYTGSDRGGYILKLWDDMVPKFVKVMPKDYKRMLECIDRAEKSGLKGEEALLKAFQENVSESAKAGK